MGRTASLTLVEHGRPEPTHCRMDKYLSALEGPTPRCVGSGGTSLTTSNRPVDKSAR